MIYRVVRYFPNGRMGEVIKEFSTEEEAIAYKEQMEIRDSYMKYEVKPYETDEAPEDIPDFFDLKEYLKENKLLKEGLQASDLKIGDKILYTYSHPEVDGGRIQKIRGEVGDHFGDGVFVLLDKSLHIPNQSKNANPMGYNTDILIKTFELYDGEENDWGSLKNVTKLINESNDDSQIKDDYKTWLQHHKNRKGEDGFLKEMSKRYALSVPKIKKILNLDESINEEEETYPKNIEIPIGTTFNWDGKNPGVYEVVGFPRPTTARYKNSIYVRDEEGYVELWFRGSVELALEDSENSL